MYHYTDEQNDKNHFVIYKIKIFYVKTIIF